jgi:succinate-semialdehyde dehydrogenase/glutarate-semialdehyde dehydrogenase
MENVLLFIDGLWVDGARQRKLNIQSPATGSVIGTVAQAEVSDLEAAVKSAAFGSAFERGKVIRQAADILRERANRIADILTAEQGKPLGEALTEVLVSADILDWFAEEGRRAYGQIIPARSTSISQVSIREPVGVVAAFTPWNFPVSQVASKLGAAIAAGCSVVLKAAEETPGSPAAFVQAFSDAGLPRGVLNLVYGNPAEISNTLIPHPVVQKISFTGSVPVGKKLAAMAGQHMKRSTMELGGHAPVMVFEDADIEQASNLMRFSKFRNAGQVCISPTRFVLHESVYDEFVSRFTASARAIRVGLGTSPDTEMGPLVSERRRSSVEELIEEAVSKGARVETGGGRRGNIGYFLEPTVLTDVTTDMRIMNEEPFGPVALMIRAKSIEEFVCEANRLPYGLAAYAFTNSASNMKEIEERVKTGMLSVNHLGLALPEVPFGGIKDSGYGVEGGSEGILPYFNTKFVTRRL